ncbi:MAG TPA: hypothetical protein VM888_04210 [Chitinophagaceae bacterium]|nr:hypothetical protein [Chitinophagaceae bacterium]
MEVTMMRNKPSRLDKGMLLTRIEKFLRWKDKYGYYSYDQYNFWSTEYGIWSKGLYHKSKRLGAAFVAPIFVTEIFWPAGRKLVTSKKRFPIADAHFILAYLNLYNYTSNKNYLDEAESLAEALLESSIPDFSGHCWGYPFDWMTTRGLWTSGVPLITTTGYCFEAFLELYDVTGNDKYLSIAHSIFLFTLNDLKDTPIEEGVSACSYSPIDDSQILNANAYRSMVLTEGYKRFKNLKALETAKLNLAFILKNQQPDGSWLYAANDERDAFVDNFHTCFVLKNLLKANRIINDEKITLAIKKGFDFYKNNLFDDKGSPLPFVKLPRVNIVKRELYDYAEGISLCVNMQELDSHASAILEKLVYELVNTYQKEDGSFVTRISIFNIPNKVPYLRWPQAQLFYALTNYLIKN